MENMPQARKLTLNEGALVNFETVRKWSLFFSILGFIWIGFCVLMLIGLSVSTSFIPAGAFGPGKFVALPFIFMMIVFIGIYFFPILYMYKFSVHSKHALENLDEDSAALAMRYLKKHFQFVGVLTIIFIGLYLLIGVFAGIGAVAGM